MTDIILTPDDLTLADEMNHLYSSKNGVNLTDNQVEFLRLLGVKNRSQATTKKLKMLIKLYRQEKRFLAAKAKAQGMIKREKDAKRKQEDTKKIKALNQLCKKDIIEFLNEIDSLFINKVLSKKNVIDYILEQGKDQRIKQWILNRR